VQHPIICPGREERGHLSNLVDANSSIPAWTPYRYSLYLHWMNQTAAACCFTPDLLEVTLFEPPPALPMKAKHKDLGRPPSHHHSRRDKPSSDTARLTIKKTSLYPTSRRSCHALSGPDPRPSRQRSIRPGAKISAPQDRAGHAHGTLAVSGYLTGGDPQRRFAGDAYLGRGQRAVPGLPVHPRQPQVGFVSSRFPQA
jgi:hypothetical protein